MRSFSTLLAVAVTALFAAHHAKADQNYYGSPSLLPNPTATAAQGNSGPALHYVQQTSGRAPQSVLQQNTVPSGYNSEPVVEMHDQMATGETCGTGVAGYGSSCGCAGDVGYSLYGSGPASHGWFASASGLIMDFDADDHTRFSYDNTLGAQYSTLDSKDASMDYSGGFEVRLGKYFNCGQNAIELVYWGIFPSSQSVTTTGGGGNNVRSYMDYQWVTNPSATQNGAFYSVGSSAQRLQRDWQFHNVEVNLMSFCYSCGGGCGGCNSCSSGLGGIGHFQPHGFTATVGLGIRYFRFDDFLRFSTAQAGNPAPYVYDDATQLDHTVDIENNLVGVQLNGAIDYQLGCRTKFRAATKFGVYGNHVTQHQMINNTNGYFTYGGNDFNHASNKDDVAFIGELDLGLNYKINCHWNASIGYRAVVAAGVALAPSQMPQDIRDISDVRYIETNNSLILHGGYAGLEFNY